jgi:hypothetical protein
LRTRLFEQDTYRERIDATYDGANLYATAKTLGFDIDYKRLLKELMAALFPTTDIHQNKGHVALCHNWTC